MDGIALITVLAITGGAIAYIGDKLGTKVGKRKLTIFGLRPKHTSILVTIVTGILITSATIGILSLTSRDVRTALFGMEALKAELSSLSAEVSGKNQELETSRVALETKTTEYTVLTAKIQETAEKLIAITSELSVVITERDRTAFALTQVQTDLGRAADEIQELQATKNELDSKVNTLNEAKVNLQRDLDHLNELTTNLKKGMQFVREGSVIFRSGEVISTVVLQGGQSIADTEQALTEVIYKANQGIVMKLGVADKNTDILWIAKADFDSVVTSLVASSQAVIVRVISTNNSIYGEPVIGHIDLFPNRLLYAQNDIVYSEVLDISNNERQAEETIVAFLHKVNAAAIKQGILPDPIQGTVGVMSGAQLYEAINKVKGYSGRVAITAAAKGNIYTAGPLEIEIRFRSSL